MNLDTFTKNKKIGFFWGSVFLWCALIYFFSDQPNLKTNFGVWDLILRKTAHITEYAILFLLSRRAFFNTVNKNFAGAFGGIFALLYAASDEYHQSFVVGRVCSVIDVLIDGFGILVGFLCLYLYTRIKGKKDANT